MTAWIKAAIALAAIFHVAAAAAQEETYATMEGHFAKPPSPLSYEGLIRDSFNSASPLIYRKCPAEQSTPGPVTLRTALVFNEAGKIVTGSWVQAIRVTGCGNDADWTLTFSKISESSMSRTLHLVGESKADEQTQVAAHTAAAAAANSVARCNANYFTRNTHFVGYEGEAGGKLTPWKEVWTLIGCGKLVDVTLTFRPQANGEIEISRLPGTVMQFNADGSLSAAPEEKPLTLTTKAVAGTKVKVTAVANVKNNCSASLMAPIEILTPPTNGKAVLESEPIDSKFPANDPRAACGTDKKPGVTLYYTSNDDFVGSDSILIEVFDGAGHPTHIQFVLNVGQQ